MQLATLSSAALALVPVLTFLAILLYLDSYKLVRMRTVLVVLLCGAVAALVTYPVNAALLKLTGLEVTAFTRYVGPFSEELLKAVIVVVLVRTHRIGFLVDAAILGFAIGTGFSVVENLYYLDHFRDAGMATWIVRGFGTALMHGGATALVSVVALALIESAPRLRALVFAPGLILAIALHSGFNHLVEWPEIATIAMLLVLPLVLYLVFERSDQAVGHWLGTGIDADAEMLELINSGRVSDSPLGQYLTTLKRKFAGPVVADVLCYLRLYTELALRAKGVLMMRENGFETSIDDETRAKFDEMRYLEGSVGKTALLAIRPMLHMSHKDLWQLYVLQE
ncbi:MAG TPA: PrsW family glutamic-type intramembrane protease [Casimicrobiaceae bacterium]|nr:PrsW family glutamic-type intramembrane protease [Casimicrobiaceae bacterium]